MNSNTSKTRLMEYETNEKNYSVINMTYDRRSIQDNFMFKITT